VLFPVSVHPAPPKKTSLVGKENLVMVFQSDLHRKRTPLEVESSIIDWQSKHQP